LRNTIFPGCARKINEVAGPLQIRFDYSSRTREHFLRFRRQQIKTTCDLYLVAVENLERKAFGVGSNFDSTLFKKENH
jgi:hypothetical protein